MFYVDSAQNSNIWCNLVRNVVQRQCLTADEGRASFFLNLNPKVFLL